MGSPWLFTERTETYDDGSSYTYCWHECEPIRRLMLARFAFKNVWHPQHRRLARLRSLYWVLLRFHDAEICDRCGGPVRVVFHVPDAIWETVTGYARFPDGEAAPGCLCPSCVDDLYALAVPRGNAGYLRWTCRADDSVMRG